MDQATHLLRQASFDRATVHMLCRVLDEGWEQIRAHCVGALLEKAGRCNIAYGILAYAKAGQRDPKALRVYAVTRALSLLGPPSRRGSGMKALPEATSTATAGARVVDNIVGAVDYHAQPGVRDEIQG